MSNDPTKIYDDKFYTFPEQKKDNRWDWEKYRDEDEKNKQGDPKYDLIKFPIAKMGFTQNKMDDTFKPLPKMSYQEFTTKFKNEIENIRTGLEANGNYHKAVLVMVRKKYGVKYQGNQAKPSEEALQDIFDADADKGKGKEYLNTAKVMADELNTVGTDWHTNLIIPYQESLLQKKGQLLKEQKQKIQDTEREAELEKFQQRYTLDEYPKQDSVKLISNAQILSYKDFVHKYQNVIKGRAKALEKKGEYTGERAHFVATMQIAQLVYGVNLKEMRTQDNRTVTGYQYGKYKKLTEHIKARIAQKPVHKQAAEVIQNTGDVMSFFWNTGVCLDDRYEHKLDTDWYEKAQQFQKLREAKIDSLRENQRQERSAEYGQNLANQARQKEYKKQLAALRHSKTKEALSNLGIGLLGLGLTVASGGGLAALTSEPLIVMFLEADEIVGAVRALIQPEEELDPNKEYRILRGKFIDWGGKIGETGYDLISLAVDGKSIVESFLEKNQGKNTITGSVIAHTIQTSKDRYEFYMEIKGNITGEDK